MLVIIFFRLPPVAVEIRSLDCEPKNPCPLIRLFNCDCVCDINASVCVCAFEKCSYTLSVILNACFLYVDVMIVRGRYEF